MKYILIAFALAIAYILGAANRKVEVFEVPVPTDCDCMLSPHRSEIGVSGSVDIIGTSGEDHIHRVYYKNLNELAHILALIHRELNGEDVWMIGRD